MAGKGRPKSDVDRVVWGVRVDPALKKQMKRLAVDEELPVGHLLEDAIRFYLDERKPMKDLLQEEAPRKGKSSRKKT